MDGESMMVRMQGCTIKYEVLDVIQFNSTRKRMTVRIATTPSTQL